MPYSLYIINYLTGKQATSHTGSYTKPTTLFLSLSTRGLCCPFCNERKKHQRDTWQLYRGVAYSYFLDIK